MQKLNAAAASERRVSPFFSCRAVESMTASPSRCLTTLQSAQSDRKIGISGVIGTGCTTDAGKEQGVSVWGNEAGFAASVAIGKSDIPQFIDGHVREMRNQNGLGKSAVDTARTDTESSVLSLAPKNTSTCGLNTARLGTSDILAGVLLRGPADDR